MLNQKLYNSIQLKKSFLCIGLDTDINKIPEFLKKESDPIFTFNKAIIDATYKYSIAYKPNTAFYEALGADAWKSLEKTANYIKKNYPDIFLIADAKRGDIGNTSSKYAETFFKRMNFDAVTISPYMGYDTVVPFLEYPNKAVIILALTSNNSAKDFQYTKENNVFLYQKVLEKCSNWGNKDQIMFVVGATKAELFCSVRNIVKDNFLLVPGIGAQGGNLEEVIKNGKNSIGGLIINSSRGIIYAGNDKDFAQKAETAAQNLQIEMEKLL